MSRQHRRKQRFKLRSFYIWHRYMGVSAALFVILVTVTGLLLNHTESFEFDSSHIQSDWLLDWYGIKAPQTLLSFTAKDRHITLMGEHLYLNRKEIKGNHHQLQGAVYANDMFVVAVSNGILLLTERGQLIEKLSGKDGVPAGVKQIGITPEGSVAVGTGHEIYNADDNFVRWIRWNADAPPIRWATAGPVEPELKSALQSHFRKEVLPVERVLLDLHSGRFFGQFGPWVIDAAAVLLLLLALSGLWIWMHRRR
jgi:hypothetical protein